ncbi:MAG: DUF1282 domain-containing protein [Pedobacter sp.]|nr:MAG: DUF1282 domain-containing protein [Pedobacter sp.]
MALSSSPKMILNFIVDPIGIYERSVSKIRTAAPYILIAASLYLVSSRFWDKSDNISLPSSLIASGLIGGVVQYGLFCLFAFGIASLGKYFGGKASYKDAFTVLTWSLLPLVLGFLIYLVFYSIYGADMLRKSNTELAFVGQLFKYINAVLIIWSFYILIKGIKHIQQISHVKSLGLFVAVFICFALFFFLPILFAMFL